jgi:hypothetical protein
MVTDKDWASSEGTWVTNMRWGESAKHLSCCDVRASFDDNSPRKLTLVTHETGEQQVIGGGGETDAGLRGVG